MAGAAPKGSQLDARQYDAKMSELLGSDGQDFFTSYDEITSENNAASNHSNGYAACTRNKKGFSEKASDAQDISPLKYGSASNLSNTYIEMLGDCDRLDNESDVHESETKENSGTFGSDIVHLDEALNSVASRLKTGKCFC